SRNTSSFCVSLSFRFFTKYSSISSSVGCALRSTTHLHPPPCPIPGMRILCTRHWCHLCPLAHIRPAFMHLQWPGFVSPHLAHVSYQVVSHFSLQNVFSSKTILER